VSFIGSRIRCSRLIGVLLVYFAASWVVVQVANELGEALELPGWVSPTAVVLLLVGLVVVVATTWVQSHPSTPARAQREEVPDAWELGLGELASSLRSGRVPHPTWSRVILGGTIAFSLLFGFAGLYVVVQDRGRSLVPPAVQAEAAPGLAVLPFNVSGTDLEAWREGMVDLLSLNLDGTGGLRTVDSRTVLARWRERVAADGDLDLPATLEVARLSGASHAITGAVVSNGPQARLSATIREVAGGQTLEQVAVDGPADSLIGLVDQLSALIVPVLLGEGAAATTGFDIRRLTTGSFAALKSYLEGEALYRDGDFEAAAAAYQRAVEADSGFALAQYRLVAASGWTQEGAGPEAAQTYQRLTMLADRLPARERLLVRASEAVSRGDAHLVDSLRQAVTRRPDDAEAWYMLGESYYHMPLATLAGFEAVREALSRAVELDPDALPYRIHLLDVAFLDRPDSARSLVLIERFERAGGKEIAERYRRAHRLMFGDSLTWEAERPWFETASDRDVVRIYVLLGHPSAWPARERLMRWYVDRIPYDEKPNVVMGLAIGAFEQRGRLGQAVRLVDSLPGPTLIVSNDRACLLLQMQRETGAVPEEVLRRHAYPEPAEATGGVALYCGYLLAALGGRHAHAQRLRSSIVTAAAAARAEGNTSAATPDTADLRLLDHLANRYSGRPDPMTDSISPRGVPPPRFFRRLAGELLLGADRPRDAVPWLLATRDDPLAHLYLGKAYEALNQPAEAREAYEYFLTWWDEVDPEAARPVDEARAGLERIATRPD
jgi:tetratricopeptide (TPR) repeat protein